MEKVVLTAKKRAVNSKSLRNSLRNEGRVLGVFYSKHDEPVAIDVTEKALKPLVYTAETHLVGLQIEGDKEHECILKDVQFDPITDKVIHFDLLGLTTGETFQLEVPIQFIGSPVGVKEGGVLQEFLHKLDIECLPKDIPQHIEVKIQDLRVGDAIHVSDLAAEGITILNPEDAVIVAVTHPKVEKTEEETGEEEGTEPEVIAKGKAEDEED